MEHLYGGMFQCLNTEDFDQWIFWLFLFFQCLGVGAFVKRNVLNIGIWNNFEQWLFNYLIILIISRISMLKCWSNCIEEGLNFWILKIIIDNLINFWHCWGDRVTTKINGRKLNNQIIKRTNQKNQNLWLIGKLPMRPISTKVIDTLKKMTWCYATWQ